MNETTDAPQERESMEFDVVIVGAGPAGLAAAIHLKKMAQEKGTDLSVTVLEKGSEVGAHILSGAVIDPIGLDKLLPEWREDAEGLATKVTSDEFLVLSKTGKTKLPNIFLPPFMKNHGAYIASLGNICRYLAEKAESLGVEIYPGFAAAEIVYDDKGAVKGVATGDMGVSRSGEKKDIFERGIELHGKYTLIAEGVRGSLAKELISKFDLDENADPQKYGIGLKELWEVEPDKHQKGLVRHSFGWPLDNKTGGGSFIYHFDENLVAVGFVVHLNYENPHLSPFDEFQRFKNHPSIRPTFEGGKRISYGARAISEGGFQSVPKLSFPGGALIGCSAGFVNVPRIKGSHNAILSGMLAADAIIDAIQAGRSHDELDAYQQAYETSSIFKELKKVRNVKPFWSKYGTVMGVMLGGIDMWMNALGIGLPFTLKHEKADHECMKRADECPEIDYPKPDGEVSFDKLSSVFLSATNHEEDQPVHLKLTDPDIPIAENLPKYGEPARLYCPAGVYEVVEEAGGPRFQINAQNCVHCKTCDIKDPAQNINWTVPEGAGGPNYPNM